MNMKKEINWRRVGGATLLLLAFSLFAYIVWSNMYIDSNCIVNGLGSTLVSHDASKKFELGPAFIVVLWCIQYFIPSLWLGYRMMRKNWQPMKTWVLGIIGVICTLGLATSVYITYSQVSFLNLLGNNFGKTLEIYPIYFTHDIGYVMLSFVICNMVLGLVWFGYSLNRMNPVKTIKMMLIILSGIIFELMEFLSCWIGYGFMNIDDIR